MRVDPVKPVYQSQDNFSKNKEKEEDRKRRFQRIFQAEQTKLSEEQVASSDFILPPEEVEESQETLSSTKEEVDKYKAFRERIAYEVSVSQMLASRSIQQVDVEQIQPEEKGFSKTLKMKGRDR